MDLQPDRQMVSQRDTWRGRQTHGEADRHMETDILIGRQTHREADILIGRQPHGEGDRHTDRLTDRWRGRQTY